MDNTQLLLSAAIVITTIIIVFIGIQLISVLRAIRKLIIKTNDYFDDDEDNNPLKAKKVNKKKADSIFSILNKITSLSSPHEKTKKYFVKESKFSGEVEKHR